MAFTDTVLIAKLYETRDNLLKQKLELSVSPKPTYNIDGQQIEWTDYLKYLDKALLDINHIILIYEGPYEETSQFLPI